jgi:hypothetical protein
MRRLHSVAGWRSKFSSPLNGNVVFLSQEPQQVPRFFAMANGDFFLMCGDYDLNSREMTGIGAWLTAARCVGSTYGYPYMESRSISLCGA